MKLKITEQGWENFSGNLGITQFEDGVSVNDVTRAEFNNITGNIRAVNAETGDAVCGLDCDAILQDVPFVSSRLQTLEEILAGQVPQVAEEAVAPVVVEKQFTQEGLEAVADKGGIAGLREISDTIGVKGTSIAGLISAILASQTGGQPVAELLDEVAPVIIAAEEKAE